MCQWLSCLLRCSADGVPAERHAGDSGQVVDGDALNVISRLTAAINGHPESAAGCEESTAGCKARSSERRAVLTGPSALSGRRERPLPVDKLAGAAGRVVGSRSNRAHEQSAALESD